MTSRTFQIGDEVEVIDSNPAQRFVISEVSTEGFDEPCYSAAGVDFWYPARCLRLVAKKKTALPEELKVGDWVEVIGPCGDGYIPCSDDPKIIQIREINRVGYFHGVDFGRPGYPASSLRKLSSVEGMIMERLAAVEKRLERSRDPYHHHC